MVGSFHTLKEWREARSTRKDINGAETRNVKETQKWTPPEEGRLKVNVDVLFFPNAEAFTVGMVIRDYTGAFIEGKNLSLPSPSTVFEAESIGIREALSWMMARQDRRVIVETDSLLTVYAIHGKSDNLFEVGHIVEHCRAMLQSTTEVRVTHIRKQAHKVAHVLARIPCLINCYNIFTSSPINFVRD